MPPAKACQFSITQIAFNFVRLFLQNRPLMEKFETLLFYKYVFIENAEKFASDHLDFCNSLGLNGRVIIAEEGINGTVAGTFIQTKKYRDHLHADARFEDLVFKTEACERVPFVKMHVRHKKEIVHFGNASVDAWKNSGKYLLPEQWFEIMNEEDTVLLDVRNKTEWEVGKFKNAITLNIDHFREFPEQLPALSSYKNKKILAYCTGGIRCEKATAFLHENGFKNVFHLRGGIIEYAKKTGGKDFDGKMYVFDSRMAVEVNEINPTVISRCAICGRPTTRFINCANADCNKHFLMCEECGWELEGCCSDACRQHPKKRKYDGHGYYQKGWTPAET